MTEAGEPRDEYLLECPSCLCEYDALRSAWCSCDAQRPTKMCPFCLGCLCSMPDAKDHFWDHAPASMAEEKQILKARRMLFGDILLRAGIITGEELACALVAQRVKGIRFGDALVELNILGRDEIDEFLQLQETVVTFDLDDVVLDLHLIGELGLDFCRGKRVLPLEKETFKDQTLLTLAMADPADNETIELIQTKNACRVLPGRASEEAILAALDAQNLS